jgi:hypothetical protein
LAGGVRSDGRVALGHRVNDGDSGHEATRTAEQPPNLFRFVGLTGCLPRLAWVDAGDLSGEALRVIDWRSPLDHRLAIAIARRSCCDSQVRRLQYRSATIGSTRIARRAGM